MHILFEKFIGFSGQSITQLLYIQLNVLPFIEEVVMGLASILFFFASIFFCFPLRLEEVFHISALFFPFFASFLFRFPMVFFCLLQFH